ncbi:hypothetical protein SEVIR_5G013050v4 [Setaria viridis]|uniref:Uncharacterized protein n=1 Tax=Setaria viridis TaxID=4556 RepID=A0A4U6U8J1_SETVI|nr:hypothetical protein SEVIR_5G013050v2 [Setaria viridis]
MCTVEVVAAGKKVVPQPPTPEQDALKPLTPEQDALKLPAPEQGALKLPAPQQKFLKRLTPRHMREKEWWIQDGQSKELLALLANKDQATWDEVVVTILNMVRCREFIEYNRKTDLRHVRQDRRRAVPS